MRALLPVLFLVVAGCLDHLGHEGEPDLEQESMRPGVGVPFEPTPGQTARANVLEIALVRRPVDGEGISSEMAANETRHDGYWKDVGEGEEHDRRWVAGWLPRAWSATVVTVSHDGPSRNVRERNVTWDGNYQTDVRGQREGLGYSLSGPRTDPSHPWFTLWLAGTGTPIYDGLWGESPRDERVESPLNVTVPNQNRSFERDPPEMFMGAVAVDDPVIVRYVYSVNETAPDGTVTRASYSVEATAVMRFVPREALRESV